MNPSHPFTRYFKSIGAGLLIASVCLLLGEWGLHWGADYFLREKARIPVRIGRFFINPATSRVSLSLAGYVPGQDLKLDLGAVRFDWWTIFRKRLRLGHISIQGLRLDIRRDAQGLTTVGGVPLAVQSSPAPATREPHSASTSHPWGVGVGQIDIQDVRLDYQDPKVKAALVIHHFHMDAAESWLPDKLTPFDAEFELNGGRLQLSGTCSPFRAVPLVNAHLNVTDLPLSWLGAALKHPGLDGSLGGTFIVDALEVRSATPTASIRLNTFEIQSAQLKWIDHAYHPTFRWTIGSLNAKLSDIDSADQAKTTHFELAVEINRYEKISLKGQAALFGNVPDGRLDFKVDGLDLTPFTPFAEGQIGYRLATGLLDFKIKAEVRHGMLESSNGLVAHELHFEKLKTEDLDPSAQQIGLPLNLCLGLLRDADDNIRLDVPLAGDLRDPKTPVGRLVWQLLGKAFVAALRAAATAFFPSGTKLGYDPIVFVAGQAPLTPEATAYLAKVGEKLAQHPEAAIKLSGWTAGADWYALKRDHPPSPPVPLDLAKLSAQDKDQLLGLASQRAQTIRAFLAENFHVDPKRLLESAPQIDPSVQGQARAELALP